MDEFVSKKLLVAKFNELASKYIDGDKRQRGLAYITAADMIALADAADVQPVKRGFWKALMMSEETGWDLSLTCGHDAVCEYVCSVCGKPAIIDEFGAVFLPDYCPNCGARMDLKDGGAE